MFENVGSFELDALKELGNMGAGHAATSLSKLLGKYIDMSVPEVKTAKISELDKIINVTEFVGGTLARLNNQEGEEVGYLYVVFPKDSSLRLIEMLVGTDSLGELEISALVEVGNILSSSFCNAIADFLGIVLIPGIPDLKIGKFSDIIDHAVKDIREKSSYMIVFENKLKELEGAIDVYLILIPSITFFEKLIDILKEKS